MQQARADSSTACRKRVFQETDSKNSEQNSTSHLVYFMRKSAEVRLVARWNYRHWLSELGEDQSW